MARYIGLAAIVVVVPLAACVIPPQNNTYIDQNYAAQQADANARIESKNVDDVKIIDEGKVPANYRALIDAKWADILSDPDSRKVEYGKQPHGGIACGTINAKNKFGGYVGKQPYVAVFNSAGELVSLNTYSAEDLPVVNRATLYSDPLYSQFVGLYQCGFIPG